MSIYNNEQGEWITATGAARILDVDIQSVMKLGKRGYVTMKILPGCYPRYRRSDVERLAQEMIRPATAGAAAAR